MGSSSSSRSLAIPKSSTTSRSSGPSRRRQAYFEAHRLEAGQRIGLWSINSIEYVLSLLALLRLGCTAVLLNTALSGAEFLAICQQSALTALIYGEGYKNCLYEPMVGQLLGPSPIRYVRLDQVAREVEACPYDEASLQSLPDRSTPDETALILFTSGSSGASKAVCLSHVSLCRNGHALQQGLRWTTADRLCVSVPLFHCFGITACLIPALHVGLSLVILPRYRSEAAFAEIERHRCTGLSGVPSMFLAMAHNPKRSHYDLSSIRSGIVAGSAITPEDYLLARSLFSPDMHLLPSYGQTETSPCCTLVDFDAPLELAAHTVGRAIEGVELRIRALEGDDLCPPGEVGEIETAGYHLMQGYFRDPVATAERMTADGYLKTGDLGCLDAEGNLRIVGRKKQLIIRGGENIAPIEIEAPLRQHPGIADVAVVAVPDPILQDEICACWVPKPGVSVSEEQLRHHLTAFLSDYKIPRYWVPFEALPYTENGKLALSHLTAEACRHLGLSPPPDTAPHLPHLREQ